MSARAASSSARKSVKAILPRWRALRARMSAAFLTIGNGASSSAACPAIIALRTRRSWSTKRSCDRASASARAAGLKPLYSAMKIPTLADFRRVVVKVGSSLLVDRRAGRLRHAWLASLSADLAEFHRGKRDVLVVSSGAIALGRAVLKRPAGPLKLEDSQAAAAVGQIALARTWSEALSQHGIIAGQVLVTLGDTEERRRYLNARSTIDTLLAWRALPVIN